MSVESNKRGITVSAVGLVVQGALLALLLVVMLVTGSPVAWSIMLAQVGGLGVWLASLVLFYCRHTAEVEQREMAQLAADKGESGIFGEVADEMRVAQRRLRWMERFLPSGLTLAMAAYHLAVAGMLVRRMSLLPGPGETEMTLAWAFFSLGGAFLAFLVSRYAIGMSHNPDWRLLRAGGSYLSYASALTVALAAVFFCQHLEITWPYWAVLWAVPVVLVVLAIELVLNFILDFYRPRVEGIESRFSFDSRLLNLLAEPGSVARSLAEALNYQFGFEVSGTWFYQLLQKAFLPLLLFGTAVLFAVSSLVLVGPGQEAVVLNWGRAPAGQETLGPGLHLKLPWPIQTAELVDVEHIRRIAIGVGEDRDASDDRVRRHDGDEVEVYLWTEEHGQREEYNLLAARQFQASGEDGRETVSPTTAPAEADGTDNQPVSLVRIVGDVHYRVAEVYDFAFGVDEPEALLNRIADRELMILAASRDIDSLMSSQRRELGEILARRIQAQADARQLGVQVTGVYLQGIHPPAEVAGAFENVINADLGAEAAIQRARGDAEVTLSEAAGSSTMAYRLLEAIRRVNELEDRGAPPAEIDRAELAAERLLWGAVGVDDGGLRAGGAASELIAVAQANRWTEVNQARAQIEEYLRQREAYADAPQLYRQSQLLDVLAAAMADARKIVIGLDPARLEVRFDKQQTRDVAGGFVGLEE